MNTFEADLPQDSAAEQSSEEIKREEAMGGKLNPAQESTFPLTHNEPLSLAFKRQVLSTARAYLSEKQEERQPGDRLGLRCAVLASRRTSKASRFIRNLKENAIEQKLLAVEKRMQHMEGDETGPDQMLDEACQLAAQLHELSNNDSINLEIGQIAESITVCTDLLNNLRATGLSHTLHLEQIAEDLNGVHEGHGISKALLSELQKDIAAMRSAIESMKIGSGTVAPVAASNSGRCPTVDTAESMCPLLDNLEERTTILLSEMGEAAEAWIPAASNPNKG
ncbi:unnamed protein product [Cladocopium goreaui]|uniref:Uncharacterized protein n=1 Tax=Cladocopium goreaui TaxID=2562237 RepID=A0A9P1BU97_9DINO|nr:unnamed protein product [Cladocopium goreaui]